jgi:hypothetical protein
VYHDGRGSEPMIDVGSIFPADALNIFLRSFSIAGRDARSVNTESTSAPAASCPAQYGNS